MGNKSQAGEMMWVFYSELGTALHRGVLTDALPCSTSVLVPGLQPSLWDRKSMRWMQTHCCTHTLEHGCLLPGTRFTSLINTTGEPGLENRTALCPAWSLHRPMDTLLLGKEKFSITREPSKVGLQSTAAPRTMGLSPNTAATAFSYSVWVFGIWQRT